MSARPSTTSGSTPMATPLVSTSSGGHVSMAARVSEVFGGPGGEIAKLGRYALSVSGTMMFVAGMAQFICSIIVLKNSGYTFGQWYVGLMCVVCGARALHKTLTQKQVQATFVGAVLCCIVCLAGVIVDAIKYKIIEPLKSCASESTTEGTSCGSSYGGIYNCVGESSYFASAATCEAYDQYNNDITANCACTAEYCVSSTGCTCWYINGYTSCDYIVNDFADAIKTSMVLTSFCLVIGFLLMLVSCKYGWGATANSASARAPAFQADSSFPYVLSTSEVIVQPTVVAGATQATAATTGGTYAAPQYNSAYSSSNSEAKNPVYAASTIV